MIQEEEELVSDEATRAGKGNWRGTEKASSGSSTPSRGARLTQLRERMPSLRQREQALRAELQSIADQANDRASLLRLAETLTAFLARLHSAADTLDVAERQRIVRLVVKDVLVGDDNIVIRHCIPAMSTLPPDNGPPAPIQPKGRTDSESYLLRTGGDFSVAQ